MMRPRDRAGLLLVVAVAVGLEVFRQVWFEPRAIGLACLHGTGAAAICGARSAMGWLTHFQVMGGGALVLGVVAVATGWFAAALAAVCLGVAGLIDYNVSWGMLGFALGAWAWLLVCSGAPGWSRGRSVGIAARPADT